MRRRRGDPVVLVAALLATPLSPGPAWAQRGDPEREARLARAEAVMAAEPTVAETREAATRYLSVTPEAIERVRHLLRSKAGAPVLTASSWYEHVEATDEVRITPPGGSPLRETAGGFRADQASGALLLGWNLPDAVFTPAELQSYALTDIQMQVLRMVNNWYYLRRQLGLRLVVDPPVDPRARASLGIRVRELTTLLDVATGGWFSRQLPEGSPERPAPRPREGRGGGMEERR